MLQKRDGRTRVYRRRNKRFARNCILEVNYSGGGSVMMCDAISFARKPQLVYIPGNRSAAGYRDEVLTPHMLPAMNICREGFQHNARPHISRSPVEFLTNQNLTVLSGLLNHRISTQ
jgi:hypothetical protein